jgi:hypothetical protein
MGCHDYGLPVDVGWRTGIPCTQRLCPWSHVEEVGDEHQLIFMCPALRAHLLSVKTFVHFTDMKFGAVFVARRPSLCIAHFIADRFDY